MSKYKKLFLDLLNEKNKDKNGYIVLNLQEFRKKLEIPKTYKTFDIRDKIIKSLIQQCNLKNLNIKISKTIVRIFYAERIGRNDSFDLNSITIAILNEQEFKIMFETDLIKSVKAKVEVNLNSNLVRQSLYKNNKIFKYRFGVNQIVYYSLSADKQLAELNYIKKYYSIHKDEILNFLSIFFASNQKVSHAMLKNEIFMRQNCIFNKTLFNKREIKTLLRIMPFFEKLNSDDVKFTMQKTANFPKNYEF